MSAEANLWAALRDAARGVGHFARIENMVGTGMPDVTYCIEGCEGFIELKAIPKPRNETRIIRIPHYTPTQRLWAIKRSEAGGKVWVLIKLGTGVSAEHVLLDGAWAARYLGKIATLLVLRAAAHYRSGCHLDMPQLRSVLTNRMDGL